MQPPPPHQHQSPYGIGPHQPPPHWPVYGQPPPPHAMQQPPQQQQQQPQQQQQQQPSHHMMQQHHQMAHPHPQAGYYPMTGPPPPPPPHAMQQPQQQQQMQQPSHHMMQQHHQMGHPHPQAGYYPMTGPPPPPPHAMQQPQQQQQLQQPSHHMMPHHQQMGHPHPQAGYYSVTGPPPPPPHAMQQPQQQQQMQQPSHHMMQQHHQMAHPHPQAGYYPMTGPPPPPPHAMQQPQQQQQMQQPHHMMQQHHQMAHPHPQTGYYPMTGPPPPPHAMQQPQQQQQMQQPPHHMMQQHHQMAHPHPQAGYYPMTGPPPPPPPHAMQPQQQQHPSQPPMQGQMQPPHPQQQQMQQHPHPISAPQPHPQQPHPVSQGQPMSQVPMQQHAQLPPPASPHLPPRSTHTPQYPPSSQTPTKTGLVHGSTPASPINLPKIDRKDITFPKNSVEATKPIITKKRRYTSKDVTDIEVWRLLMCLKSGLLAESSWAIDVLSILLNDDTTIAHFNLQNMPGLLEAVLEHFKCCLNDLFDGIVSDTILKPEHAEKKAADVPSIKKEAVGKKNNTNSNNNSNNINNNNDLKTTNNNINGIKEDSKVSKVVINQKKINGVVDNASPNVSISKLEDQIIMFDSSKNYTFKTRDGKSVKMKNEPKPVQDDSAYEIVFKPVSYSHWQEGCGEDTSHIQIYFEQDNYIETTKRCSCLSTIIRNLSFVAGNDVEMSKHAGLLLVIGRLLLLKHDDLINNEPENSPIEWHILSTLREDSLVVISNISSSLDLSPYNDKITLSLLDGLLHWACCSSSYALDPFPAPSMTVSPQRLALESLAKLSIIEGNVDLILATPPWVRIERLFEVLTRLLSPNEEQTVREFSLVLLSNLASADSGIARKVAMTGNAIPRLISFLEMSLIDPESFSTTQDMLRRAAITLKFLSQLVDNHPLFAQHQPRLLNLVMSQKLDQEVVPIIADVIFEISLSH